MVKLFGEVVKFSGDFMPPMDDEPVGEPLSVPLHLFKGKVACFDIPDLNHPNLYKVLHSDVNGKYETEIESGTFTIIAVINDKMYSTCHENIQISDKLIPHWESFKVEDIDVYIVIKDTQNAYC